MDNPESIVERENRIKAMLEHANYNSVLAKLDNGWDREDLFRDKVYPVQPKRDNDKVVPWSSGDIEKAAEEIEREIERQKNRPKEETSAFERFRIEIEKQAILKKQRQAREEAAKEAAKEKTPEDKEITEQYERMKQRYKEIQQKKMIENLKAVKKPIMKPVEKVQVKNTMFLKCINNLGIEDRFDLDSAYEGFVHGDKEMIWVIGNDGNKDEYLKERFEELPE
jgi:hypothetical protein